MQNIIYKNNPKILSFMFFFAVCIFLPQQTVYAQSENYYKDKTIDYLWSKVVNYSNVSHIISDSSETIPKKQKVRNFQISLGFSLLEYISLSVGYRLFGNYGFAVKASAVGNGAAFGIPEVQLGFIFTKYFDNYLISTRLFNVDALSLSYSKTGGSGNQKIDLSLGSEKIHNSGTNFLWRVGLSAYLNANNKATVAPFILIGFIINL